MRHPTGAQWSFLFCILLCGVACTSTALTSALGRAAENSPNSGASGGGFSGGVVWDRIAIAPEVKSCELIWVHPRTGRRFCLLQQGRRLPIRAMMDRPGRCTRRRPTPGRRAWSSRSSSTRRTICGCTPLRCTAGARRSLRWTAARRGGRWGRATSITWPSILPTAIAKRSWPASTKPTTASSLRGTLQPGNPPGKTST